MDNESDNLDDVQTPDPKKEVQICPQCGQTLPVELPAAPNVPVDVDPYEGSLGYQWV